MKLLAIAAALLCAQGLVGQVTVAGKVVDENSVALAGARIELRAGPHEGAALSDVAGNFSLNLPVPGRYRIRATCTGFFIFDGETELRDGANQLQVTLHHLQEFFQTVDVAYSPPAIDPQQPADQKQLNGVEILQVPYPASQDVRNAMPLFSGVVQDNSGRLHFNGGATDQTNFTLDGFNLSDPVTGRFDARLNIEAVRSIDFDSSRFSAQKGRGSAGSVDLKTGMGDDRFRFATTNFVPGVTFVQGAHINKWTPRLKLSGPIARGRAWFHNAMDVFYDVDTVTDLPRGENRSRALTASNLSRVQVNLTPANILTGTFLYNYTDDNHRGLSFLDPIETTLDRRQDFYLASIKDQIYFRRGALIEFGFAGSRGFTRDRPQGRSTYEILPSGRRGNYFLHLAGHQERQQWVMNGYLPTTHSHQLQFGVDLQRSSFDRFQDRHDYHVLRADLSVARSVTFEGNPFYGRGNFDAAMYVQDRWTPAAGLLLEAGLRIDWDEVVRDAVFSPRVSAAYAPEWAGGTKFAAGIGVFHNALSLSAISRHQDQIALSTFFAPDGAVRRGPIETSFMVNDRELRVPRYNTFSASVERKLPLGLYGKSSYMRRVGRRGLTYFTEIEAFGVPSVFRLLNGRNDRYDALELTVRRTFAGNFEWFAGYTRSSARSDAVVDFSLENPIFAEQGPGPFAWDTPHRFLMWGWTPVPRRLLPHWLAFAARDTDVAYLFETRTGFPFGAVNEEGFLVGRPNERRLPAYFNLNLHFERKFRLLRYLWAWRFGFNNVTNSGNPNTVNNNVDSPSFLTYGRGQLRAFQVRLRFLGRL